MGGFPNASGGTTPVQGISGGTPIPTTAAVPAAANVLDGSQIFAVTAAATTVITIPAGRVWVGQILASCAAQNAAANAATAEARATISVAGAGAAPAAGTLFEVECLAGAGAVGGVMGAQSTNGATIRAVVIAPAGNAVTLQAAATITGTGGRVSVAALGELQ